jgi:hypothetical protein
MSDDPRDGSPAPRGGSGDEVQEAAQRNPSHDYDFAVPLRTIRRIAEAADGFRDGAQFWLVCRYESGPKHNYDITKHRDPDEARGVAERKNQGSQPLPARPDYGVFGPFVSGPPEEERRPIMDIYIQPQGKPLQSLGQALKEGGYWDGDPGKPLPCDMIAWSRSAIEKFAEPYYLRVVDVDGVTELRGAFSDGETFGIIHLPTTDYVEMPGMHPDSQANTVTLWFDGGEIRVGPAR